MILSTAHPIFTQAYFHKLFFSLFAAKNLSRLTRIMKISIIPDTNVLISNLDRIIGLLDSPLPDGSAICISRIVLRELDKLKIKSREARAAIRFLEAVADSVRIQIEGIVHLNRMESENESCGEIPAENNDDQIINYIFKQENAVFLTNDVVLALRCKTYSIKVLEASKNTTEQLLSSILSLFNVGEARRLVPDAEGSIEDLKNAVLNAIAPRIREIAFNELGTEYDIIMDRLKSLEDYLSQVTKNFFIYRKYLPNKSEHIIRGFQLDLRRGCKFNELLERSRILCSLFQAKLLLR